MFWNFIREPFFLITDSSVFPLPFEIKLSFYNFSPWVNKNKKKRSKMAAFVAKQMVGNKLSAVKGESRNLLPL